MRFIVDAQLPFKLASFMRKRGHDVIHTDDLPDKEHTSDTEIRRIARLQSRIVVSKDSDFVDSHLLLQEPAKLLWVSTGNIRNPTLFQLFEQYWPEIERQFLHHNFLELNNTNLVTY